MPAIARHVAHLLLSTLIAACSAPAPEVGSVRGAAGQGTDGDLIVQGRAVLNRYAALALDARRGDRQIALSDSAGVSRLMPLLPGDVLLIIQMQGALVSTENSPTFGQIEDLNGAGGYEFIGVSEVDPERNVVTLLDACGGLRNNYSAAGRTQVIRVPQYGGLTVAGGGQVVAPAWDGRIGGVVALMATGAIIVEGAIDVSGGGFRGAPRNENSQRRAKGNSDFYASLGKLDGGLKGEGVAGSVLQMPNVGPYGRGALANAGGGGNRQMAGAGGGGGAGDPSRWRGNGFMYDVPAPTPNPRMCGANAGWLRDTEITAGQLTRDSGGGRGGYSYSDASQDPCRVGPGDPSWGGDERLQRGGLGGRPMQAHVGESVFLGGGGGGGDDYLGAAGAGGNGGGIVLLLASGVSGGGAIRASGTAGADTQLLDLSEARGGAGGGGGGGSIVIDAATFQGVRLEANGGKGGDQRSGTVAAAGPGGGGGGGYVAAPGDLGRAAISLLGGAGGRSSSPPMVDFPANGATQGGAGVVESVSASGQAQPTCYAADLQLVLRAPQQLSATAATGLTLTVSNRGPSPSSRITAQVALPDDTEVEGVQGTGWRCAEDVEGRSCILDRLAVDGSSSLTLMLLPPLGVRTVTIDARVSGSPADPDLSNNTRSVTLGVDDVLSESALGGGLACTAAPGRAAGGPWRGAWLVLLLLGLPRCARKRRGAQATARAGPLRLGLALGLGLGFGPGPGPGAARAQSAGFGLNRHDPPPPGAWFLAVEMPYFNRTRSFAAGIAMNYAHNPLIYRLSSERYGVLQTSPLISQHTEFSFDFAGALFDRLQLALSIPVIAPESGVAEAKVVPMTSASIGDPRVSVVARIFGQPEYSRLTLSAGASLWIPLRSLGPDLPQQAGDLGPRVHARLIASGTLPRVHYSAVVGFLYRQSAQLGGAETGSAVTLGLAAGYYNPDWRLSAGPELLLSTAVDGRALRREGMSLEALIGAQYNVLRQAQVGLALGVGALSEPGTPDLRLLLRVAYAPQRPPDRDRDGILDKNDACPDQPGQPSGVPSNHGCPPLQDRDCDGVPDGEDLCPDVPEGAGGGSIGCPADVRRQAR